MYVDGKDPHKNCYIQYKCPICNATLESPDLDSGKVPYCPNCNVQGEHCGYKNAPNFPGKQINDPTIMQNVPLAASGTYNSLKNARRYKEKGKNRIPAKITDCGVEPCFSEEFEMMSDPNAEENIENMDNMIRHKKLKNIRDSAEYLFCGPEE